MRKRPLSLACALVLLCAGCAALFGVTPGNPEAADGGTEGSMPAPPSASACDSAVSCEDLASDGHDGDVLLTGQLEINSASAGASTDANGGSADGIAYRVVADPVGSELHLGAFALGFAAGDKAFVINLQGAAADDENVGNYEVVEVTGAAGSVLSLASRLQKKYGGKDFGAQRVVVQRIPEYGQVTLAASAVVTAGPWDGLASSAGPVKTGIVAFFTRKLTLEAGARIDVRGLGHTGGASGGNAPDTFHGVLAMNGSRGESGTVGIATSSESGGGSGGAGGGLALGGAAGSGGRDGEPGNALGATATGGGGGSGSFLGGSLYPGPGGNGHEGGGGGGGRNDNTTALFGGGGGGGKPITYASRDDAARTALACARITLSGGAPAGGGGGTRGGRGFSGTGGEPKGGKAGGRGAGIILLRAAVLVTNSPDQLVADGEMGGDGGDGESSAIVTADNAQAGGGGGAGGQGATGGSICLETSEAVVVPGALSAKGGRGGQGGSGGGATTDGAVGARSPGGAGATFAIGNERGSRGMGGAQFTSGAGGGGAGGNSGWAGTVYVGPLL